MGEEFLGWSMKNFLVENFLESPADERFEDVGPGGDMIFDDS